jgi:hypothetical protein
MRKTTARFVEWLLRLLLPAPGRHRAVGIRPGVRRRDTPTVRLARVPLAHVWVPHGPDVPGTGLVRLYVVAHERQRQRGAVGCGVKAVAT